MAGRSRPIVCRPPVASQFSDSDSDFMEGSDDMTEFQPSYVGGGDGGGGASGVSGQAPRHDAPQPPPPPQRNRRTHRHRRSWGIPSLISRQGSRSNLGIDAGISRAHELIRWVPGGWGWLAG